jgi:hypothetical protein
LSGEILYIGEDEGPTCQVCGEARTGSTEVACAECGTLHHKDCWEYVGHCSIFGCKGKRWTKPHDGEIVVLRIDENTPTPKLPQVSRARGTNVPSARANTGADAPVARSMWVRSRAVDLTGNKVRLDLSTPLENSLAGLAFLGFILAFAMAEVAHMAMFPAIFGAVMGFLWLQTDCTYILNNEDRTLDYRRHVLSWKEESPVAAFEEIEVVTTKGTFHKSKHSSWWEYRPVAILRNGSILDLTDSVRNDLNTADDNARAFARHVGARYVPGQPERQLQVSWTQGHPEVQHRPRRTLLGLLFD